MLPVSGLPRAVPVIALVSLLLGFGGSVAAASVAAYRITSPDPLLIGQFADGQLGDYMLENDRIAVVISDIGHTVYYALTGGNIIDAGGSDERVDALGEFYTYFNDEWPRQAMYDALDIVDDGSSGGPAVIRVTGEESNNPALLVMTEYSLADEDDHVTITSTLVNTGPGTVSDFELGDAFFWGECEKFVPGYGFLVTGNTSEPWMAGTDVQVSYGYLSALGDVWGPHDGGWSDLNTVAVNLGPGDSTDYERYLAVGGHDVASVATVIHAAGGMPVGSLDCTVTSEGTGEPLAGATINTFDELDDIYLQMVTDDGGLAGTTLPPGNWRLVAGIAGHLQAEVWLAIDAGGTASHDFVLPIDGGIPAIGDTLTVIRRPLINLPALVTVGDTLAIDCAADPATIGWAAELVHGALSVPLPVLAAAYDPGTTWWRLSALIPPVDVYELYDLRVSAAGGIEDATSNAVRVIPEFRNDYYFVHITDTHLPTTLYHEDPGAKSDSSSVIDLREIIEDLNVINPEFVLLTGDVINEGELEEYLYWRVYTRTQRLLTELQVPVFLVAGNHDIGGWDSTPPPDGTARRDWWRFFGWPRLDAPPPGAPWYTQNYSFDYGPVHYVGLESYINYDQWRWQIYGETSFINGQLQWLTDDLAAAGGSAAQVLFYHFDFDGQIDLNALGVEMALWGHIHRDAGSITTQPYDLATNNASAGERSYRLIRVAGGELHPTATIAAGAGGNNLRVDFQPANNGNHEQVSAQITNQLDERFEHAQLRFLMPNVAGSVEVTGGTLLQIDDSGPVAIYYVGVDIESGSSQTVSVALSPTGIVGESSPPAPLMPELRQNYPNPFNPATVLRFALPRASRVRLSVHDVSGREVAVLLEDMRSAGEHRATWDGSDGRGRALASGIYVVRLQAAEDVLARKVMLLR